MMFSARSEHSNTFIEALNVFRLHIPKNDENKSFINEEKLSWMKNNSALINTSRGAIVDEDALYKWRPAARLV